MKSIALLTLFLVALSSSARADESNDKSYMWFASQGVDTYLGATFKPEACKFVADYLNAGASNGIARCKSHKQMKPPEVPMTDLSMLVIVFRDDHEDSMLGVFTQCANLAQIMNTRFATDRTPAQAICR